jgi:PKD repeat protein
VDFDAAGSDDPDPGDSISYAWDLDGDGQYDDAAGPTAAFTYGAAGSYLAAVQVTDSHGVSASDAVAITAGNTPPTAAIAEPSPGVTWKVNEPIAFAGAATDEQDGDLGPARLDWKLAIQHCPSTCHEHVVQTWSGVGGGSFAAPDHEYPSYLELTLTATDSGGLTDTATLRLDPRTVVLTFQTTPGGLQLVVNDASAKASFTRTVIIGSSNSVSAPTPQAKGKKTYGFLSWSDGGTQTHVIVAPAVATTYTARYR